MSVSLTSSGLYLEPRVYTTVDGNNYGTPKFITGGGVSLGGGTWTGIYNGGDSNNPMLQKAINVSSTPGSGSLGGGIYFRVS